MRGERGAVREIIDAAEWRELGLALLALLQHVLGLLPLRIEQTRVAGHEQFEAPMVFIGIELLLALAFLVQPPSGRE